MNFKKIGIWTGAFIGSFLVIATVVYFLFPYLNPDRASSVEKTNTQDQASTYDPADYSLQAADSLNTQISVLQNQVESLRDSVNIKQLVIDSLLANKESTSLAQPVAENASTEMISEDIPAIEEATKPLLSLDEDALAPIVDLLNEQQLIDLYRDGTGRQRKKLLRTLKPDKAALILKKVM